MTKKPVTKKNICNALKKISERYKAVLEIFEEKNNIIEEIKLYLQMQDQLIDKGYVITNLEIKSKKTGEIVFQTPKQGK